MKVDRRPHILRDNRSVASPRNMIFFDVESRLEREGERLYHKPYLFVAYWHYKRSEKGRKPTEEWFHTDNPSDFWNWVSSKVSSKEALYMFAHNPTYDLVAGYAFPTLKVKGYRITRYYEKGRTFIIEFKAEKKTIIVLNVGNFYQGSVADIGKAFGLPKLELDYENPTLEEALPYCKRDVEIIAKAMLIWFDFCKRNDLGHFGVTAPKQAFNAFRHRFMKYKIYIHADEAANNLERESYCGGRTEAFFIGYLSHQKIITLDVNSMYPAVMKKGIYPTKLVALRRNLTPQGLKYVQEVFDYIWKMHDCIMSHIYAHVVPRIAVLEQWRLDVAACLHNYIEATLLTLVQWRYAVANWLHTYIEPKIHALEVWRANVVAWLHNYIERLLLETVANLEAFRQATARAFQDVWETFRSIRVGVLSLATSLLQGITTDVLPNVWELIKNLTTSLARATGIPAILSALGAWLASLFDGMAKELKTDMDFLEALELDWLLIAYLGITKPVLIDRADDVLNVLFSSFKQIAKPQS